MSITVFLWERDILGILEHHNSKSWVYHKGIFLNWEMTSLLHGWERKHIGMSKMYVWMRMIKCWHHLHIIFHSSNGQFISFPEKKPAYLKKKKKSIVYPSYGTQHFNTDHPEKVSFKTPSPHGGQPKPRTMKKKRCPSVCLLLQWDTGGRQLRGPAVAFSCLSHLHRRVRWSNRECQSCLRLSPLQVLYSND